LVLTLNFKVVGNQVDWTARHQRMLRLTRRGPKASGVTAGRVAASSSVILWLVAGVAPTTVLSAHLLMHLILLALAVVALVMVHVLLLLLTKLLALHVAGVRARWVLGCV